MNVAVCGGTVSTEFPRLRSGGYLTISKSATTRIVCTAPLMHVARAGPHHRVVTSPVSTDDGGLLRPALPRQSQRHEPPSRVALLLFPSPGTQTQPAQRYGVSASFWRMEGKVGHERCVSLSSIQIGHRSSALASARTTAIGRFCCKSPGGASAASALRRRRKYNSSRCRCEEFRFFNCLGWDFDSIRGRCVERYAGH